MHTYRVIRPFSNVSAIPAIRTCRRALSKYSLGQLCNYTFPDPCCYILFFSSFYMRNPFLKFCRWVLIPLYIAALTAKSDFQETTQSCIPEDRNLLYNIFSKLYVIFLMLLSCRPVGYANKLNIPSFSAWAVCHTLQPDVLPSHKMA
jgi:hypothetical protein